MRAWEWASSGRLALAAATVALAAGQGVDLRAATADTDFHAVADAKTRAFLNDLSSRRRVTTLFPNRQHQRDGVQIHFVNTSRGNLTFLRRDLVRVDRMPIVAGRVYDSSMADQGDFGPGWKFALDERIEDGGSGELVYTEASGASHRLNVAGAAITPAHPASAPIRSGRFDGASIVLLGGGLERRFDRIGSAATGASSR